ncbi:hypothetical protein PIB30_075986 [Stylosanthes scabra]|uniref:RNase H type-1 domain-containing protein n=1 Tax=Stylosanthes scabra TaxID=79078 RepID=A0ABU6YPI6_9FABA|nr:hypothetical protein [Stylosanthes scabra]
MGFGCVIRDWKGNWKKGYAGTIPPSDILKDIWCEIDCHEAYILLKADTSAANNEATDLIRRIHDLMRHTWRVEISLIQRSANVVADALAKYAVLHGVDQVQLLIPRYDIKELLKQDMEA